MQRKMLDIAKWKYNRQYLWKTLLPLLLLSPALLLSGTIFVSPLVQAVSSSLQVDGNFSFEHYQYFFNSSGYQADLWFTLGLGVGTVALSSLIAVPLALLFRHNFKHKTWLWGLALVPLVTPHIIAAYALRLTLSSASPLFFWLPEDAKPQLVNTWLGLLLALVWKFYPVMLLPLVATLSGLPDQFEEAARDLGAGRWRTLRTILWPLIAPGWLVGATLVLILAVSQFSITLVIYGGQKLTAIPLDVYFEQFSSRNTGLAAALGLILTLVTLALTIAASLYSRYATRPWINNISGLGTAHQVGVKVNRWALTSATIGLSLLVLVPLICLILYSVSDQWLGHSLLPTRYTLRWFDYLFKYEGGLAALGQSLGIGLGCVWVTLLAAIPAGYALARYQFWGRALLEALFLAKTATPVIVLGVGIATLFYSWRLADTYWGIVLAHSVGALPLAVRNISTAFGRVDLSQEEAAQDLGAGAFRRFCSIILPKALGGISSAAALSFLFSMDEFTITFLISGVNYSTLPLRLYSSLNQGYIEPASAAAVILLVPSLLYLTLLLKLLGTERLAPEANPG